MPNLETISNVKVADTEEIRRRKCEYREASDRAMGGVIIPCSHNEPIFCKYVDYRAWRGNPRKAVCGYPLR